MSGQTHCGYFVPILMVICGLTVLTVAQVPIPVPIPVVPQPCAKFDFDQPANLFAPHFIIKAYSNVTNPTPYRPNHRSFLTNKLPGFSFAQPSTILTLNQTTSIEALVYFQPVGGAYFDISVRDVKSNIVTQILHISTFTSWQIAVKHIAKIIPDGRIELTASMTPQSILAIQYLNILNPAVNRPECKSAPPLPAPTPPGTIPVQPQAPANPNDIWWWVISSICLATLLIVIILVGIYCIIDIRRSHSHEFSNK